jgi:hypothetical protein
VDTAQVIERDVQTWSSPLTNKFALPADLPRQPSSVVFFPRHPFGSQSANDKSLVSTPGLMNHIWAQRGGDGGDWHSERRSPAHDHCLAQRIRCCRR